MRSFDALFYVPAPRPVRASRDLAPQERAARVTARPPLAVGPWGPWGPWDAGSSRTYRSEVY